MESRVQLAKNVRVTKQALDMALAAVEKATKFKEQYESESDAISHLNEYGLDENSFAHRKVLLDKNLLAAKRAQSESSGSKVNLNIKQLNYSSAVQKYDNQLNVDAHIKIGHHPRIIININVEIDGVLQPKIMRIDPTLHTFVESTGIIPNENVNEQLKVLFKELDEFSLDGKDTTSIRKSIDMIRTQGNENEAILYAPLHAVSLLEEFQSPVRITRMTRNLKLKRDALRLQQKYADADKIQHELNEITYPEVDSSKITENIKLLLRLLFSGEFSYNGQKCIVSGHEWLNNYPPFGFQIRRRTVDVRIVNPGLIPSADRILSRYATAINTHITVPIVEEDENMIEKLFVDIGDPILSEPKSIVGGGILDKVKQFDKSIVTAPKYLTASILKGLEHLVNAVPTIAKKSGLSSYIRSTAESAMPLTLGVIHAAIQSDPINPFAIFKTVLTDPTQYGLRKNIEWNSHIGRYISPTTQTSKCRVFIYEYLAYRCSIYNDFFKKERYSAYADLPFMVDSRKNSDLIHGLLIDSFDPDMQTPLQSLLKKWTNYDREFYNRAAKLQHYDALILRFLCREVLLRTLTETACAINILSAKLMMRQAAACRNRDNSFICVQKLDQLAAKLFSGMNKIKHTALVEQSVTLGDNESRPTINNTPLVEILQKNGYMVNGAAVPGEFAKLDCAEAPDSKGIDPGRYVQILETAIEEMKKSQDMRVYVSFSHAPPCFKLTQSILQAKLKLYETRIKVMQTVSVIPEETLNKLYSLLTEKILDSAKHILTGKQLEELYFGYAPDLIKNLTEFKCKSHTPPKFDAWYTDLNRLHSAYKEEMDTLYNPISQLVRVVHDLYASTNKQDKHSFQSLNRLDYTITAFEIISAACNKEYADIDIDIATKPKNETNAEKYLQLVFDFMDGIPRFIAKPNIMLAKQISTDNTKGILNILKGSNTLTELNLHMPLRLSAKEVWKTFKELAIDNKDDEAFKFLTQTDFKSNAEAAHDLYDTIPSLIRAHDYIKCIQILRIILSFNVYQYNWNQFYKLPTKSAQRMQLNFLLGNMNAGFKVEMKDHISPNVFDPTVFDFNSTLDEQINLAEVVAAYKRTIEQRLIRVLKYIYIVLTAIGNREEAAVYKKRLDNSSAANYWRTYYASLDAKRAGQSVYDIETQFRATEEWTVDKLIDKIQNFPSSNQKDAFLLQYSTLSWKDPRINYESVVKLMSPDHAINHLIQHLSTALFPEEVDIEPARKFVCELMYAYRHDPGKNDYVTHRTDLIAIALKRLNLDSAKLSIDVDEEINKFKPSPTLQTAVKYLNRASRAQENLWPGEPLPQTKMAEFFQPITNGIANLTTNLPYLDGEYTININTRVKLISEKNKLYQLRLKETLTCDEKKTEAKLLREALFSKFTSIIPTLPVAKAIP